LSDEAPDELDESIGEAVEIDEVADMDEAVELEETDDEQAENTVHLLQDDDEDVTVSADDEDEQIESDEEGVEDSTDEDRTVHIEEDKIDPDDGKKSETPQSEKFDTKRFD
jgi:hypothetical protein